MLSFILAVTFLFGAPHHQVVKWTPCVRVAASAHKPGTLQGVTGGDFGGPCTVTVHKH